MYICESSPKKDLSFNLNYTSSIAYPLKPNYFSQLVIDIVISYFHGIR